MKRNFIPKPALQHKYQILNIKVRLEECSNAKNEGLEAN